MRPKTKTIPGKVINWKLLSNEEQEVLNWFDAQGVYVDSLRYLVQKDIAENGIRNLQQFIPQNRTIESIRSTLDHSPGTPLYSNRDTVQSEEKQIVRSVSSTVDTKTQEVEFIKQDSNIELLQQSDNRSKTNQETEGKLIQPAPIATEVQVKANELDSNTKILGSNDSGRKPKKTFSQEELESFS